MLRRGVARAVQDDIKRVLAYSTISQLAYMVAALAIGPPGDTAGFFHLFTHAFFKALLFLGAGSVIHAVHTNNMSEMGGLRKKMPVTFWTFLIGVAGARRHPAARRVLVEGRAARRRVTRRTRLAVSRSSLLTGA